MGYETVPIPAGWTWQDETTGRPWETVGDQLTFTGWTGAWPPELRWDIERWDWSAWGGYRAADALVRYRSPLVGSWQEWPGRVLSASCTTGVALWYLGPRAGSASVVVEQTTTPAPRPELGDDLQILAQTPAGEYKAIWFGRVLSLKDQLIAGRALSTLRITGTDLLGWSFQAGSDAVTAVADLPDDVPAGNNISLLFVAAWFADLPLAYDGIDRLAGFNVYGYDSSREIGVSGSVGELVRGDLGLLWTTPDGVIRFLPHNWWVTGIVYNPVAAIGSDPLPTFAFGRTGYQFPASRVATVETVADVINQITWSRTDKDGLVVGTTTQAPSPASLDKYSRRVRSDSVKHFVGADMVNAAFVLQSALSTEGRRLVSVDFPADTDWQAGEYAAKAQPGDLVLVKLETQHYTFTTDVQGWVPAHVTAITHTLDPTSGWGVSLTLETRTVGLSSIVAVPPT